MKLGENLSTEDIQKELEAVEGVMEVEIRHSSYITVTTKVKGRPDEKISKEIYRVERLLRDRLEDRLEDKNISLYFIINYGL